jgi:hypothetical protein
MPGGRLSPSGAGYADQPATSEVTALPPATHVDAPHHHRGPWRRHVAAVARGRQPGSVAVAGPSPWRASRLGPVVRGDAGPVRHRSRDGLGLWPP